MLVDGPPEAYGHLETIATAIGQRSQWNRQRKADVSLIARGQQLDAPIQINIRYMAMRGIATRELSIGGSSLLGRGGPFGGGMFPHGFGPQISNRGVGGSADESVRRATLLL